MSDDAKPLDDLLDTPHLADALESDRFKQFLDHIPFAVAVAELRPRERITYVNLEYERLTGQTAADIHGKSWSSMATKAAALEGARPLSEAVIGDEDYIGAFTIDDGSTRIVDAWANVILDDHGTPTFRLLALAERRAGRTELSDLAQRIQERDVALRELQHRVKNNLQMITALIRLEARNLRDDATSERFDRLAGRVHALGLLYHALSENGDGETVDLGVYLSQIASAVMQAHAVEGIRLDLKVDAWPVSINVAMPAGLVVNELLTNALKHAFAGRERGEIMLHSLVGDEGCEVVIADDGTGLPDDAAWPKPGSLGALIVRSLRQNAHARIDVASAPGQGVRVTILFTRADAAPEG
jgi:PAS domain S-box-containing protein